MKIAIIGGGAAGLMAGGFLSKQGHTVTIFDGNEKCGKKLYITGKGRCNVTNACEKEEYLENVVNGRKFMMSAINQFSPSDTQSFFESLGVKLKVERGNRVFPLSDKASDIIKALTLHCGDCEIKLNEIVKAIEKRDSFYVVLTSDNKYQFDRVIIATGGMSYKATGSSGDGYKIAKKLGHTITKLQPSLIPLTVNKVSLILCKQLQGLSLRNISIKLIDKSKNKKIYEEFGEMLFTHFGVTGPVIISSSSHLVRYKNIEELLETRQIELSIDLKPALDLEKLDMRIIRDFEKYKNKSFKNSLNDLLPQKMIDIIIEISNINPEKKVNEITKEERRQLREIIKNLKFTIIRFRPIEEAIVTSGGIDIKEINPKTMESKLIKGLYFAGEIIDVDGYTGGFNLQIAWSTGYTAGSKIN